MIYTRWVLRYLFRPCHRCVLDEVHFILRDSRTALFHSESYYHSTAYMAGLLCIADESVPIE